MKKLLVASCLAFVGAVHAEPLEDGARLTIVGSIKSTKAFSVESGRVGEVQTYVLVPKDPSPPFERGLTVQPPPSSGLTRFASLPAVEISADCVVRLSKTGERPVCELHSYGASPNRQSVPRDVLRAQQEAEDARIRMKSFDPATAGKTAFIFSAAVDETISRASMVTILYRDTPCRLPLASAKDMLAAEILHGRALVAGCWGRLVSPTKDKVLIVSMYGDARQDSLTAYIESKIQRDGSAQYVKPAMSQEELMKNIRSYHESLR